MRPAFRAALIAPVLTTMLMAGQCTTTGGRGSSFCETARPQRPSLAEIRTMTPARQREVLAHNEYGANQCGWRP